MRCEQLNKLGLGLSEDWNVSDLILASRNGYLEGFSDEQLDKLGVLNEAITEYLVSIPVNQNVAITNADLATFYLYPLMKNLDIKRMRLSVGGFTQTTIDNKQILRNAILLGAQGIIIAHNHPTDDPRPSKSDVLSTKSLERSCAALELTLLDHIIIANSSYYSFQEEKVSKYNKEVLNALAAA